MTQMSMFSSEELPAKASVSLDSERDWMTRVATSSLHILPLLQNIAPASWFTKTSPASCHRTAEGILEPCSGEWQNSGMGSPTKFLTLNTSEWNHTLEPSLSDDGVSSLSDILETGDVPQRFYLSAKACAGILRRAESRGKDLPPALFEALTVVATLTMPEQDTSSESLEEEMEPTDEEES